MKKLIAAITMASVFGLMVTVGALAQTAPGTGTTQQPTVTTPQTPPPAGAPGDRERTPGMTGTRPGTAMEPMGVNEVYASNILGANVRNPQGENLGTIDELVIDPKENRIKAAVLSVGGVLGIGARSVSIPWEQVQMGPERDTVVVAMGREDIERAPEWQRPAR